MFWSLQLPYRNVYSAAYDNGYENDFRLTLSFNTPYKYDYQCDYATLMWTRLNIDRLLDVIQLNKTSFKTEIISWELIYSSRT